MRGEEEPERSWDGVMDIVKALWCGPPASRALPPSLQDVSRAKVEAWLQEQ